MSSAAAPGLFDVTVQNDSPEMAYSGLQHAVATLSPAVRHKLQGLPADVLDYADLIPGTSVEQPILKPVLIAGERGACLPAHVTLDRAHHEPNMQTSRACACLVLMVRGSWNASTPAALKFYIRVAPLQTSLPDRLVCYNVQTASWTSLACLLVGNSGRVLCN